MSLFFKVCENSFHVSHVDSLWHELSQWGQIIYEIASRFSSFSLISSFTKKYFWKLRMLKVNLGGAEKGHPFFSHCILANKMCSQKLKNKRKWKQFARSFTKKSLESFYKNWYNFLQVPKMVLSVYLMKNCMVSPTEFRVKIILAPMCLYR